MDFVQHHYQRFDFWRSDTGNSHNDSSVLRAQQLPDIWPEEKAENAQFWPDAGNFTTHPHLWIFFARPLLFLSSIFGERKVFFPVLQRSQFILRLSKLLPEALRGPSVPNSHYFPQLSAPYTMDHLLNVETLMLEPQCWGLELDSLWGLFPVNAI